jgi:UPF0716 family protein affecting phage T7 exclusion
MAIGIGVVLLVVGAVLAFAVNADVAGIDIHIIGWILMAGGLLSLIIGLVIQLPRSRRARSTAVTTDDAGRHYVTERDDRIDGV